MQYTRPAALEGSSSSQEMSILNTGCGLTSQEKHFPPGRLLGKTEGRMSCKETELPGDHLQLKDKLSQNSETGNVGSAPRQRETPLAW